MFQKSQQKYEETKESGAKQSEAEQTLIHDRSAKFEMKTSIPNHQRKEPQTKCGQQDAQQSHEELKKIL